MNFVAFERNLQGTGASRRLRISGRTPGIVFGGTKEAALAIELDHNALWHAIKKEAFHSSILDMELNGSVSKVLLRDVQMHPYRQQILHVDFQRVDDKTKMTVKVPVHYSGDEESPAFKLDHCLITHIVTELQVTCFPADIPEFIAVDLTTLKKGASLHLKDITLPKGVKATIKGGAVNPVLVSVVPPKVVEEVAPAAAAAPAKGKGKK